MYDTETILNAPQIRAQIDDRKAWLDNNPQHTMRGEVMTEIEQLEEQLNEEVGKWNG